MTRSPPTPLSQVIESISNAPVLDTELEYTCVPRSRAGVVWGGCSHCRRVIVPPCLSLT